MKKLLLSVLCFLATLPAFSQEIVSGYYITNDGQKITGEYKFADFSSVENLLFRTAGGAFVAPDVKNIKEIGIGNSYKYVKYKVAVDIAKAAVESIIPDKPIFMDAEVFLNALVEGDAMLYSYYEPRAKDVKYFIKTPDMPVPQQLVYMDFIVNDKKAENNEYKVQLPKYLVCDGFKGADIVNTSYKKEPLIRYVKAYNACKGTGSIVYNNRLGRKYNLLFGAYAGLQFSSFELSGSGVPSSMPKDNGVGFNAGGELELVFPSQKLSLFLRVEAESVNAETEGTFAPDDVAGSHRVYVYETKATLVNIGLGPRYYLSNNNGNRLFVDAVASLTLGTGNLNLYDYVLSSTTQYPREFVDRYGLGNAVSFGVGVGYSFNGGFAVELRANTARNLIDDLPENAEIKYVRAGVGLKYTF